MVGKTLKKKDPDQAFRKLKSTLDLLNKNLAIYENDMARCMTDLKDRYGISSIEEAVAEAETVDKELEEMEEQLQTLANQVEKTLERYQP
jgi:chaperonin cofactor prefoldin